MAPGGHGMVGVTPPPWRPPSTSVSGLPVLDALCARILHRGVQGWLLSLSVCPQGLSEPWRASELHPLYG